MKPILICPHCQNNDPDMMELIGTIEYHRIAHPPWVSKYVCKVCSKTFEVTGDDA